MRHPSISTEPFFSPERIGRGVAGSAALTVGGLGLLFAFTFRGDLAEVVRNLSTGFLLLALLGAVVDVLLGAARYHIYVRRIRSDAPFWLAIRTDLASRLGGAVTPSSSGGGPAQVFILHRGGISVPEALSFLMINFVATLVLFLFAGGLTAWGLREHFPQGSVQYLVQWGFVAFVAALGFMVVSLVRPDLIAQPLDAVVRRLERSPARWARVVSRAGGILVESAGRYQHSCIRFVREAPWLPVASLLLTAVLYLNKFTIAWLVMRGLGVAGDYGTTVAVQALLHFVLYLAPTPGGSGIAELSTGALMSILLPTSLLGPFTLAYRLFLLYLPAALGALVLARELRPRAEVRMAVRPAAVVISIALLAGTTLRPAPVAAQERAEQSRIPVVSMQPPVDAARMRTATARHKQQVRDAVVEGLSARDDEAAKAAFTSAVTIARSLVEMAPHDPDAHYLLAAALGNRLGFAKLREKIRLGDETSREATAALELDLDHAGAHHVKGRLNAGVMRLSRIARFLARRLLGAKVMKGASWEVAEYHLRRASTLEPENPRHAVELGALYADTDRPALARAEYARAAACPGTGPGDSLVVLRATRMLASLDCEGRGCAPTRVAGGL